MTSNFVMIVCNLKLLRTKEGLESNTNTNSSDTPFQNSPIHRFMSNDHDYESNMTYILQFISNTMSTMSKRMTP